MLYNRFSLRPLTRPLIPPLRRRHCEIFPYRCRPLLGLRYLLCSLFSLFPVCPCRLKFPQFVYKLRKLSPKLLHVADRLPCMAAALCNKGEVSNPTHAGNGNCAITLSSWQQTTSVRSLLQSSCKACEQYPVHSSHPYTTTSCSPPIAALRRVVHRMSQNIHAYLVEDP